MSFPCDTYCPDPTPLRASAGDDTPPPLDQLQRPHAAVQVRPYGHDEQLVRPGRLGLLRQAAAHGLRVADDGPGQHGGQAGVFAAGLKEDEGVLYAGTARPLSVGAGAVQAGQGARPHGGGEALGGLRRLRGQGDGGHRRPARLPAGRGGEGGAVGAHRRAAVRAGDELGED
ncbi:MAG: hypothetical protein ACK5PF_01830, partial [bacterium]